MSSPADYDFYCDIALQPGANIRKVFENERVLAYHHTQPFWETHIVVIPKQHVWDLRAVEDPGLLAELLIVSRDIMRTIPQSELDTKGAQLLTNLGKFQDTPHLHFHIAIGSKIR
jgi:histidine triad (HIT) family protein